MNAEFLTPFYRCSLRHDLTHNTCHVLMFASGCLFWWPKAGAGHLPRRLSCRGRMTLVFAGLPFGLFVVITLMSYGKPARSGGMMFPERLCTDHTRRGAGQAPAQDRSVSGHAVCTPFGSVRCVCSGSSWR
jgi:hypothetical protein